MYLAQFDGGSTRVLTAALGWTVKAGPIIPPAWTPGLLKLANVDFSLRATAKGDTAQAALLFTADGFHERELRATANSLLKIAAPADLIVPQNAAEFDSIVEPVPPSQIRVAHEGYFHGKYPVACDFRLFPVFAGREPGDEISYQVNLRPYVPDPESERRILKYIAWLDLENPFSEAVRAMQKILVQRVLERAWLADEYLAVLDDALAQRYQRQIREHFAQTTGRIGFPEAPLEAGDFSDYLVTGFHSTRESSPLENLSAMGADAFTRQELESILSFTVASPGGRAATAEVRHKPDVFISYASGDAAYATAVCRFVEAEGLTCWIAPRDVDRDVLAYPEAISRGIAQSTAVVVILSEGANLSVHIPRELDLGLKARALIVPVRFKNIKPQGQLEYLLATCQWLNAYNRSFEDAMNELVNRLRIRASGAARGQ